MIGTKKKPLEEVLEALEGYQKMGVVGCDGCAKTCANGGARQVEEMAGTLKENGKRVVFDLSPNTTCNLGNVRSFFACLEGAIKKARPCLSRMRSASGVRSSENARVRSRKSGLDTVGHMDTITRGIASGTVQRVRSMRAERHGRHLSGYKMRKVSSQRTLRGVSRGEMRGGP
jgi:hypothetical protein